MSRFSKPLIRLAVSSFQACRRAVWFVTRPRAFGVAAVPLTDDGKLVLVKLTYRTGWSLPAGGRKPDETPTAAIVRELKEEIGMTSVGAIEPKGSFDHSPDFRQATTDLFLVSGVRYTPPAWSLEIEEVREFELQQLPSDLSRGSRHQLRLAGLLRRSECTSARRQEGGINALSSGGFHFVLRALGGAHP